MAPTKNAKLLAWVEEVAALTTPDRIEWCDGSADEYDRLCQELVDAGTFTRLSDAKRPEQLLGPLGPRRRGPGRGPHLHLLGAGDRRRPDQQLARPGRDAPDTSNGLFKGCMKGRTMYVVPFSMGPLGSDIAHIGVQLTDSAYVAVSMRIMTRMGTGALEVLGEDGEFVPCLHSVGAPLEPGQHDVPWPCNAENKYIVHFPETREIVSYGSGYGGNAAPRQEVLRPAHRLGHGPRRRLDGRAHAHPQAHLPRGRDPLRHRRLPLGLRQDEPGHAHPLHRGLEGRDGRRRHLLDEVRRRRPPLRHQPRGRLLRRGARDQHAHQPQRHPDPRRQLHLHQHRADRRRRHLVGGHDRRAAGAPDRLEGRRLDAGARAPPAAHPNARFTAPASPGPGHRARVGGPQGRADQRHPLRRPPRLGGARWSSSPTTGSTACSSAPSWRRRPRPPRPVPSATCAATPSPCCRSAATTWPTTSRTGCASARKHPTATPCRRSSTSTGSARTPTASSSGPATARTRGCSSGSSTGSPTRPTAVETPIGCCPDRRCHRHDGPRRHHRAHGRSCCGSTSRAGGPRCPLIREYYAQFGDRLPAGAGRARSTRSRKRLG